MKKNFLLLVLFQMSLTFGNLHAQNIVETTDSAKNFVASKKVVTQKQENLVKLNLAGLIFKNLNLQYEHTLSRKFSLALTVSIMPTRNIPFKNSIISSLDVTDTDVKNTIEKLNISSFSIAPEVRFYVGKKGYGRGLYLAPYVKYTSLKTANMVFTYQNILNVSSTIELSGNFNTIAGGLQVGAQWMLGKHMCIDWWIVGAHYGSGNGAYTGTTNKILGADEQADLKKQLDDVSLPLINKTVTVYANGATVKLNGPWASVRTGLCIGYCF
jgi:Protein of unknown function (DUF3575)